MEMGLRLRGLIARAFGSPVRIRTSIDGVRVRSLTVRRPGNRGRAYMLVPVHGQAAEFGPLQRYSKMLNFSRAARIKVSGTGSTSARIENKK